MKTVLAGCLALCLLASPALASGPHDPVTDACGDEHAVFIANPVATAAPMPAGTNVYFIETEQKELSLCLGPCGVVLRAGLDGQWKGATRGNMYLGLAVPPGSHHLCSSWQGHGVPSQGRIKLSSLEVEPGKIYYFEAHIDAGSRDEGWVYTFGQIDPDEAKRLMVNASLSESRQKR